MSRIIAYLLLVFSMLFFVGMMVRGCKKDMKSVAYGGERSWMECQQSAHDAGARLMGC
ncbi:hypothetical protein LCGC14_1016350 [marine sediment metagenome]|uniref:Uncharacterized protein n=1 Tax=marine sediment metagenome TaxID=412755 RepID=A0A0F9NKE1_9ZZZZ